jgi:hypothetical protein
MDEMIEVFVVFIVRVTVLPSIEQEGSTINSNKETNKNETRFI